MPVKHMRIDNRLIHGQVTVTWVDSIGADHIIVVNDDVAKDSIQKKLLPRAARGVKTSVLSVDDTLAYTSQSAQNEQIFILAKFPSDALRLVQGGIKAGVVNVGNQAPRPGTVYVMVTKSIAVTKEDAQIYRDIVKQGVDLKCRMLPTDSNIDFMGLLDKKKL
jgi:mannose/fructose/N-acetylgalactosamine-specific phosphotransferase system component IIB